MISWFEMENRIENKKSLEPLILVKSIVNKNYILCVVNKTKSLIDTIASNIGYRRKMA